MNITLNGEAHETSALTVAALVESLALDTAKVAVERNLVLVPRSLHGATCLEAGDRIEVVQFVGGG
ncbi:MAG: sulfur carrier protein ThiS [Caulobacterales bacterium]|nr:sulfur carrier protein ThiS [Caulobacterales bacterium]